MSAPAEHRGGIAPAQGSVRWSVPAALLLIEYAVLSVLVDFPTSGPAVAVASAGRMLMPAALGAASAGWLISRDGTRTAARDAPGAAMAWRPWPFLPLQLAAFAATAGLARLVLGPNASPASVTGLVSVFAAASVCVLLALASAAPLRRIAGHARIHLGAHLAALAVGVLAWRAAVLAEGLWSVLQRSTVAAVGALLRLGHPNAIVAPDHAIVGLPRFTVEIAPVCSGVDGVGLVLVFQALWISLARDRLHPARTLLLVPIGAAAALAANVVRIAALVALGAAGHVDAAMGGFHSKLGWLLFLALALATVVVAEHVPWFHRGGGGARAEAGVPRRVTAYVGPLVASMAVALLTSVWATAPLDRWYAARAVAAAAVLLATRRDLPRPSLSFSWAPLLIGAAIGAAWIALTPTGDGSLGAALDPLSSSARASWIAARLAGSCLVLPVAEELAFRGFLLPWLVASEFETVSPRAWTVPALVLSSIAFGSIHAQPLLGTVAGAAFALARLRRGRLSDAVLAHSVANGAISVAVLGFGRWDLWS